jgi:hypothetical protein
MSEKIQLDGAAEARIDKQAEIHGKNEPAQELFPSPSMSAGTVPYVRTRMVAGKHDGAREQGCQRAVG